MTDAEVPGELARAGRSATWLIVAHTVFLLMFVAGGALTFWTFASNGSTSVDCFGGVTPSCGSHHSYVPGLTLLAVGFVGNLITIAVAARLAIGYGLGALARYRRQRPSPPGLPL